MEKKLSFSEVLKKYTMVIVLVLVVIMFTANTKGVMLLPQNVNNLVAQNAYVFILATGKPCSLLNRTVTPHRLLLASSCAPRSWAAMQGQSSSWPPQTFSPA